MCLAIPAKVIELKDDRLATVDILGVTRDISLDLTPQAAVGDFVLVHAGFSIEVVDPDYAQETIDLIKAHLNPDLTVSTILLTMYDGRTNLAQQVAEEVRAHFPEQTLRTTVPRSVRISEAPSYGQTVMTYDPTSTGALAYLEAARELAERVVQRADLQERA